MPGLGSRNPPGAAVPYSECWYPNDAAPAPTASATADVAPGFCASTRAQTSSSQSDCDVTPAGSFDASGWANQSLAACVARLQDCKMANYVSYSARNADCSWYQRCDMGALLLSPRGYQTQVLKAQPSPPPPPAPDCNKGFCETMAVHSDDPCKGTCRRKMNQCNNKKFAERPAICEPELRTYNTNATCGGPHDWCGGRRAALCSLV